MTGGVFDAGDDNSNACLETDAERAIMELGRN
jgi:hypothetical protein